MKTLMSKWPIDSCNTESKPMAEYNVLEDTCMRLFGAVDKGHIYKPDMSKSARQAILKDCIRFRISHGELLQQAMEGKGKYPADYLSDLLNINEKLILQLRDK